MRVNGLVEKPAPADAPSSLAVISRYVLHPDVSQVLENTARAVATRSGSPTCCKLSPGVRARR